MSNSREMKMNQLNECVKVWEVTLAEAAKELVEIYFEAAGLRSEEIEEELEGKADTEIIEMYLAL